jgi:hypothetical protein
MVGPSDTGAQLTIELVQEPLDTAVLLLRLLPAEPGQTLDD